MHRSPALQLAGMVGLALGAAALAVGCGTGFEAMRRQAPLPHTGRGVPRAAAPTPAPPTPTPEAKVPAPEGPVSLTMLEAIRYALAGNHDVQIAGYEPVRTATDITLAEAVFDPAAFASTTFGGVGRPIQSLLDTGVTRGELDEETWNFQGGLRKRFITGGEFALFENLDYLDTNSTLTFPDPQYRANLTAQLKHPLLRGAGPMVNRAVIRVATLNTEISFEDFRQKLIDVLAEVAGVYWQLAFDRELVRIEQESADQAAEVLRREGVRRDQGISKDVDVERAKTALATRRARLVRAQIRTRNTGDRIKLLLNSGAVPLDSDVEVLTADALAFVHVAVDRSEAVSKALANRPDVAGARTAIEAGRIRVDVAGHERLPKLDAVLKYTMNGLDTGLGGAVGDQNPGGPFDWSAGLELEVPLGNRAAGAEHLKRRVEYEQALLVADRAAARAIQEVNLAVRGVTAAKDEVDAALKAREAARATVSGELARFELGQTSNFDLLAAQDVLAQAERDYAQALLAFNTSLADLGRAQGTLPEDLGIELLRPGADTRQHPLEPVHGRMTGRASEVSPRD